MNKNDLKDNLKIIWNEFCHIFDQKTNFFFEIKSKGITETFYFYYLEGYISYFSEYFELIYKNDFDPLRKNQYYQEINVNKIIESFDKNFLFAIFNNQNFYDDLLKIFVAFFILKEKSKFKMINSESFLYVEKVVKKEILITYLESLITEEVIEILEKELKSLHLYEYYNQVFDS